MFSQRFFRPKKADFHNNILRTIFWATGQLQYKLLYLATGTVVFSFNSIVPVIVKIEINALSLPTYFVLIRREDINKIPNGIRWTIFFSIPRSPGFAPRNFVMDKPRDIFSEQRIRY